MCEIDILNKDLKHSIYFLYPDNPIPNFLIMILDTCGIIVENIYIYPVLENDFHF